MAGLDEVLRTFALQKMQELKEQEGNKDFTEEVNNRSTKNGNQQATDILQTNGDEGKPAVESQNCKQTDSSLSQDTLKVETDLKIKGQNLKKADPSTKDSKDKKITIKLFTKTIELETPKQEKDDVVEEEEQNEDEDEDSSSDDSEDEMETKDGKPWRKVYEEGELSPSSESGEEDEEEDGECEVKSYKEDGIDSASSGELNDENTKKSKKHKKHKHKKNKHKEKVKDKESSKDKHKDKSKKDKKKDKEKKVHKDKSKDKEKHKSKKKSKEKTDRDKEDAQEKEDGTESENFETEKHKRDKKETKDKKHKSKHKDKGDEKNKSSSKRKHKSRSRSQSPSKTKSSHKKRRHSSRSRSKSPRDHRHSSSTHSDSRDMDYYGSRSRDNYYPSRHQSDSKHRKCSRSRSPHKEDEFRIDKAKLLEIAKANAFAKMQTGEFPPYMKLTPKSVITRVDKKEGRSVEELTAVCKEIASKQKDYSDSDDSPVNRPVGSDDENNEPFIRHPFKVREAPLGIVMNIKNAVQKPIQDKDMLRLTFPVSSGSQHRKKEDELGLNPYGDWVAVEKKPKMMDPVAKPTTKIIALPGTTTMTPAEATASAVEVTLAATETSMTPSIVTPAVATEAPVAAAAAAAMPPPLTTIISTPVVPVPAAPAPVVTTPAAPLTFAGIIAGAQPSTSAIAAASAIPAAAAAAEYAAVAAAAAVSRAAEIAAARLPAPIGVAATPPVEPQKVEKVFEEVPVQKVDIAAMVSARLKAARLLESNPNDVEALTVMHKAQTQIRNWTMGKQKPGMFTGDTGLRTLRPEQLANSDPRAQAWAKKDMFHNQTPLKGGVGAMLMAKMGWKQGEGLGKNNEGLLEPLALDVKTDRKGLVAGDEQRRKKNQVPKAVFKDLSGKHPVSALMEICNKRKWAPPSFDLVQDKGPAHKKSFVFKVRINNDEYQPSVSCPNKKQAKAQAAAVALQKMGLIPADQPIVMT